MTTIDPVALVDAAASDLNELQLPEHLDWRHAPPTALVGENAPWLAVWISRTGHTPLGVEGDRLVYTDTHQLSVQWAESTPNVATVTEGEESTAPDLITVAAKIQDRMRTYAVAIPGLAGPNLEGTLTETVYGVTGDALTATVTMSIGQIPA